MNNIEQQDITCQIECAKEIPIYDADNIIDTSTLKSNQVKAEQLMRKQFQDNTTLSMVNNYTQQEQGNTQPTKVDPKLVEKLEAELKNTRDNFFHVVHPKEANQKQRRAVRSLESIQQISNIKNNSVLKQGYLEKKTDALIFKWKRRYFTLTPEKLYFFEDQKKQKVIGCINIKLVQFDVHEINDEIVLDFNNECENMILRCDNKEQQSEWARWIEQVSKFRAGQKKIFLRTMNKPFYSGGDTISERDFLSEAETGDILLFYTRHIGAQIQRVLTNSDFDHVAMVVKFRSYQTMVFESNQATGVSLFQWNQYVKYFNLYDKITYRKLISPRKSEFQHNLLKFVKIMLGRKYDLNLGKFFTFESGFSWQLVNQDVARGYFCSELIAKAYKSTGLLDPVKSSCRYWPVDFSQKKQMCLEKGASFGSEQSIVLNKHVKKIV